MTLKEAYETISHLDGYISGNTVEWTENFELAIRVAQEVLEEKLKVSEKPNNLYTVSVCSDNELKFYKKDLPKEDAELLFIELCNKEYNQDDLEKYTKEVLKDKPVGAKLTVDDYQEFIYSEIFLDSCYTDLKIWLNIQS
ncbi:hypothetical protein [Aliarcobacter butzleri]|uniref:hypothetical protein n=1 Tax=Aliarcobacter butzleri TaxID=28197 RepID=UPI001269AB1F|nr:hypothetical protein [Aliarcobacter butzleri]